MFLAETAAALKQHAARFDLENRAIECCKAMLQNLMCEDAEEARFYLREMTMEQLKFAFVKHQFVFESHRSWPHILSRVAVGCADKFDILGVEPFGTYDLETGENGEILDDWFSWEAMRDENGKLIEFSGEI